MKICKSSDIGQVFRILVKAHQHRCLPPEVQAARLSGYAKIFHQNPRHKWRKAMKTSSFDGQWVFWEDNWERLAIGCNLMIQLAVSPLNTWQVLPVECPHPLLVVLTGLSVELGDISDAWERRNVFSESVRCRSDHFISVICRFEGWFFEVPACAETLVNALLKQASPGQQHARQKMRHIIFRVNEPSLSWKKDQCKSSESVSLERIHFLRKKQGLSLRKGRKIQHFPDPFCTSPWTCLSPNWPENCWDIEMKKKPFTLLTSSHYLHLCLWKEVTKYDFPLQHLVDAV